MNLLIVALFVGTALSNGFIDTFDTSQYWYRTGGTGDGYYAAVGGVWLHTSGEHCSYYRYDPANLCFGDGIYEFDTYGPYWEFAWKITPNDPAHGWTRRLGNYPNWWSGYFMRPYAEWYGNPFSWQNGEGYTLHNYGGPDPSGLHHITIEDSNTHIKVWIDAVLVFDVDVEALPDGTVGFGSGDIYAAPPDYIPWYDNLEFTPSGVGMTSNTWGGIKINPMKDEQK